MSSGVIPALALFGVVALALAVLVLGVMLLTRSHQRRVSRKEPGRRATADPWREAGRRLEVPPED